MRSVTEWKGTLALGFEFEGGGGAAVAGGGGDNAAAAAGVGLGLTGPMWRDCKSLIKGWGVKVCIFSFLPSASSSFFDLLRHG